MIIFKPIIGSGMLVLCSLVFSANVQANTKANDTNAAPAASSGTGSVNNGPENTGSPNSGAISDGGNKTETPMDKSQSHTRHDADMKKCDNMSGDAKEACQKGAKVDRDTQKHGSTMKQ